MPCWVCSTHGLAASAEAARRRGCCQGGSHARRCSLTALQHEREGAAHAYLAHPAGGQAALLHSGGLGLEAPPLGPCCSLALPAVWQAGEPRLSSPRKRDRTATSAVWLQACTQPSPSMLCPLLRAASILPCSVRDKVPPRPLAAPASSRVCSAGQACPRHSRPRRRCLMPAAWHRWRQRRGVRCARCAAQQRIWKMMTWKSKEPRSMTDRCMSKRPLPLGTPLQAPRQHCHHHNAAAHRCSTRAGVLYRQYALAKTNMQKPAAGEVAEKAWKEAGRSGASSRQVLHCG